MSERPLSVALHQDAPIPLDVEFTCASGDVLVIFGPSGSGKTTILRAIAGLHRPVSGVVRSGAETWLDTTSGTDRPAHRRAVGLVFQEYALFPHLTALGNVAAALGHLPRADRRRRAAALLDRVHLSGRMDRRPDALSGGERQRVALARALAREPAVLLLDEPFAAVDRGVRRRLQREVAQLRQELGVPTILVTHDFEDVIRLATHVLLLDRGRSLACGPIASLMSRRDLAWLREAVGLGAVLHAVVARADARHRLAELDFGGGTLLAAASDLVVGAAVRVRVPAREVILATHRPEGISLHNVVPGTVVAIHVDPAFAHVIVQIAVGSALLLAEVTEDTIARLGIAVGGAIYALIKSVSIDVLPVPEIPAPQGAS